MLPLGPVGYGETSAFAGNPMLLSIEVLVEHGWLLQSEVTPTDDEAEDRLFHQFDFRGSGARSSNIAPLAISLLANLYGARLRGRVATPHTFAPTRSPACRLITSALQVSCGVTPPTGSELPPRDTAGGLLPARMMRDTLRGL
jgi:hypothetical protein